MTLTYDLHIHSCLSACGDGDMTPANIAAMAKLAGLQVIAVSDHNSCLNAPAAEKAARRAGLLFVPAMELTTAEEVHILCLLPSLGQARCFSSYVREHLPDRKNNVLVFGAQTVMDEEDAVVGQEERMLTAATDIGIYEVAGLLESYGGLAVPAHIDRPSFSLLENLGYYDPDMHFSCMEVTRRCDVSALRKEHPELAHIALITNSDAHFLGGIQDAGPTLEICEYSAAGVLEALRKMGA